MRIRAYEPWSMDEEQQPLVPTLILILVSSRALGT